MKKSMAPHFYFFELYLSLILLFFQTLGSYFLSFDNSKLILLYQLSFLKVNRYNQFDFQLKIHKITH